MSPIFTAPDAIKPQLLQFLCFVSHASSDLIFSEKNVSGSRWCACVCTYVHEELAKSPQPSGDCNVLCPHNQPLYPHPMQILLVSLSLLSYVKFYINIFKRQCVHHCEEVWALPLFCTLLFSEIRKTSFLGCCLRFLHFSVCTLCWVRGKTSHLTDFIQLGQHRKSVFSGGSSALSKTQVFPKFSEKLLHSVSGYRIMPCSEYQRKRLAQRQQIYNSILSTPEQN